VIGVSTIGDDEQGPPKRCGGLGGACYVGKESGEAISLW